MAGLNGKRGDVVRAEARARALQKGGVSDEFVENMDALASYVGLFRPMVKAVARQSDSAAAPPPPSKRKHRGTPHRVTLCRFKSRLRQDTRVLEEKKGKPQCQPGDPCPTCAQPRTLDTGHALYKSSVYCESEAGPGCLTAREWLISQQAPEDAGKVPRTTLWLLFPFSGRRGGRRAQRQTLERNTAPAESEAALFCFCFVLVLI
ncbi:unnamed protein product [Arctogadus glacialis]